jgi:hypothetical protein
MAGEFSVLRINTHDGKADTFPFEPHEWHASSKYDIAVISLDLIADLHQASVIPVSMFATREVVEEEGIGPGDDVYMLGRFVDHDGEVVNQPAVRFGNISVMPSIMEQGSHLGMTEAYCIDIHSCSEYSGSPVFMYRTAFSDLQGTPPEKLRRTPNFGLPLLPASVHKFLGIHFAQFPEIFRMDAASAAQVQTREGRVPLLRGAQIKGLSGMTCVLPAWAVLEVLNEPRLKDERNEGDREAEARLAREGKTSPVPEGNANS